MISPSVKEEILEKLDALPVEEQRRVLDFARALKEANPTGIPGRDLLRFGGAIDKADLESMKQAIETGCERVDSNGW
jgi:hypothetical protein